MKKGNFCLVFIVMSYCLRIVLVLCLAAVGVLVRAQESVPRRTAEERAMKQTEMLVRDLDIRDSLLRDTIYRVHLRYAKSREQVSSRSEAVERMNRLLGELKGILSPQQFERLQAIPRQQGARAHRADKDSLDQEATPPQP